MVDIQQVERLRALWKSGRDKYRSFFAVLNEVRREIGDTELANWCRTELHIGLYAIMDVSKILNEIDAKVVRADLAVANRVETERRAVELAARRKARLEEKLAQAKLKAEKEKEIEDVKFAANQKRIERIKQDDAEKRRKQKQGNKNERGEDASRKRDKRRRRQILATVSNAELSELEERLKTGDRMLKAGEKQWIEGFILMALVLHAARAKFPADQEFGAWVVAANVQVSIHDRVAFIGLGRLGEQRLREILANTDKRSPRYIWLENKPNLQVVEN